jgi:hypothetical protein
MSGAASTATASPPLLDEHAGRGFDDAEAEAA